jgi:dTDP-4-dehydrorhamnose reductase
MRLVVFGRHGQVGRALCQIYGNRSDADLLAYGRDQVDLADSAALADSIAEAAPDCVINAAAYTAVDRAEDEPELAYKINAAAPMAMAQACAALDIPIVHYSTDYVFDGKAARPYAETDPTGPLGVYGESKLAGEQAVAGQCGKHIIVRTSWVYDGEGHNFVNTMRRLGAERDTLSVVDDQFGCPTYAADLAEQTVKIVDRLVAGDPTDRQRGYGVYHLAGSGTTTWCRFARAIFAQLSAKSPQVKAITTAEFPTKAPRPAFSVLNTDKAATVFNVRMPDWQDALARCLRPI